MPTYLRVRTLDGRGLRRMAFTTRPLHEAASRRDRPQIDRLLAQGLDPNEWDATGRTPLYYLIGRRRDQVTPVGPRADPDGKRQHQFALEG